jgi:CrcB protein
LGTFVINISGSFLLGVLGTLVAQKMMPNSESMRLALGVGFLGAFTTFSTFEFETHALFDDGSWLTATTNMFCQPVRGAACRPRGNRGCQDLADVSTRHED